MDSGARHGWLVTGIVALTTLAWWTATDRLDLPKQWMLVAATVAAAAFLLLRRRPVAVDPLSLLLCAAPLLALGLAPGETAARVEGWAGWLAAVLLVALARGAAVPTVARGLAVLAVGLAGVAWLQAAGVTLFNEGLRGFLGRRVVATLGGPGHLGWTLAALLPWVAEALLPKKRKTPLPSWQTGGNWLLLALVLGAIVLSGSRVAWLMTVAGLPFWLPRRWRPALLTALVLVLGAGLAIGLDRRTGRARLGQRKSDLSASGGTARGRLYLWRVHLSALPGWLGPGQGPEGFVRTWSAAQERYLQDHPKQARFRSDLRHAHADPVEILVDFGIPGLLLGLVLLGLALWRRAASPRAPPLACVTALLVGGLGAPVLFFAPTLALGAVCLGCLLGPPRSPTRLWTWAALVITLAVAAVPLTRRVVSEVRRSEATRQHHRGEHGRAQLTARSAARIDGRNPRAWIQLARLRERAGDAPGALRAWKNAARDLPTLAVKRRVARLRRRLAGRKQARPVRRH